MTRASPQKSASGGKGHEQFSGNSVLHLEDMNKRYFLNERFPNGKPNKNSHYVTTVIDTDGHDLRANTI